MGVFDMIAAVAMFGCIAGTIQAIVKSRSTRAGKEVADEMRALRRIDPISPFRYPTGDGCS